MLDYPIFVGTSAETRAELSRRGQPRRFRAGEALVHLAESPNEIFLIKSGRVKLWCPTEAGAALTLAYLHDGELVGMVAAAQDRPQSVTATAAVETSATSWGAALLRDLIGRDRALARNMAAMLAGRAELLVHRMEEMSLARADQRIARTLARLGAEIGDHDAQHPIQLAVTQNEIAEMAQTTVPTVSRLVGRWRAEGLLTSGRGAITILKVRELCAHAGMDG